MNRADRDISSESKRAAADEDEHHEGEAEQEEGERGEPEPLQHSAPELGVGHDPVRPSVQEEAVVLAVLRHDHDITRGLVRVIGGRQRGIG